MAREHWLLLAACLLQALSTAQGYRYIGCFADTDIRDLPFLADTTSMTPNKCYSLCSARNYSYFGVQFATECWCGNSYGRHGLKAEEECNMRCTGSSTEFCGSSWRNNLFAVSDSCPADTKESFVPHKTCTCSPLPEEMNLGSLVFVIDTTGSMGSVIQSVKDNIKAIMASNTRFVNYVIATFGDPYSFNLKKTTDKAQVTAFLDVLRAEGGGDCPEYAFSGAIDAADAADPNSVMILFTDASAKDGERQNTLVDKLKAKRIRMFTVSNGNMCSLGTGQFDVLAKASDGQVASLDSAVFSKLMDFIKRGVSGTVSFTAFPLNAAALDSVLKGECACRTVNRRVCESVSKGCPVGKIETYVPQQTCSCAPLPEEMSLGSIIFLIDTTGSMGSVIQAVKDNIKAIMAANTRFTNYVIGTFGDPYVKQLLKTNNAADVTKFLDPLRADGGGDCPEYALAGAVDAANAAEKNSVMLLFTDASAKDPGREAELTEILKTKRIRLFTIASGVMCGEGTKLFDNLAKASNGQVASLQSTIFSKLMEFVKSGVNGSISFSVFPPDATALDRVLKGDCSCRTINRRSCEDINRVCPVGTTEKFVLQNTCSCAPLPEESNLGSLVFVVDATASMGRIFQSVRDNIKALIAANTKFSNYVVATFGDPYVRQLKKTVDGAEVNRILANVTASGGADCPEFSLSGIRDAADAADYNSVIILYTDASPKDSDLRNSLVELLRSKQIRVFAAAAGNMCGNGTGQYDVVAKATEGQIATFPSTTHDKLTELLKRSANGTLSLTAFPSDPAAFDSVIKGNCSCRNVYRRTCDAPGLKFIGCFVDTNSRDLPQLVGSGFMSSLKCYGLCRTQNYSYFGVQNANECWCGNNYGLYGERPGNECNTPCTGDSTTFCGAGWRNSIYATGLPPPALPTPGLQPMGCFADNSIRDLPVLGGTGDMTISRCYQLCRTRNFTYFGLQNATECWCGNSYGRYGAKPATECQKACTGDSKAFCGAPLRNNVYYTGVAITPMPGLRDLGCYVDNSARDLTKLAGTGSMTVLKCYNLCRGLSNMFMGVQNGDECWCGDSYGRYGVKDITECQMKCSGDSSLYCGAGWRNNIYATGVTPPPIPTPGIKDFGCFVDTATRDLPVLAGTGNMRVAKCYQLCRTRNYMYFGVQYADECWCGNTYGRYGAKPLTECGMRCTGEGSTFCGDSWRNNIYSTGLSRTDIMPGLLEVGCFVDSASRDLPTLAGTDTMTIEKCYQLCRSRNTAYFGLQYATECWCGDSYGKHGAKNASECNMPCTGDNKEMCGSSWRNNIYTTGLGLTNKIKLPLSGCSQHSIAFDAPCTRAIDGGTNQDFFQKTCTHTESVLGSWWQAKTEKLARITEVTIYNRQDCCAERLNDFVVKVDGQECASYQSTASFSVKTFICNLIGSVVRVENRKNTVLTLCEVQAFGQYVVARSWPPAAGVSSLGCYIDNEQRDLPLVYTAGTDATRNYCFDYCKSRGFLYFATQNGNQCTCGNSYGQFGRASDTDCNSLCEGEKSTYCGGPWRNAVYTTGLNTPLETTTGMKELGCFVDSAVRDLPVAAGSGSMGLAKCYKLCREKNQRFFGVQNGDECWCGNHYGRYEIRPRIECRAQCSGEKTQYCGAAWRNMIYMTGLDVANEAVGVKKLGCFEDTVQRDLPLVFSSEYQTSLPFCWLYCKDRGFKYFGVQYGSYCLCGNTYGLFGRASDVSCVTPCRGDKDTKCGGTWKSDIYTTGLESLSPKTPGMESLGCFLDAADRDLPTLAGSDDMSIGKCYDLCKKLGKRFFGLQYATECWCGDHYGRYGRRDRIECRMQCSGDKTTYCGAGWRNEIYTTGIADVVTGEAFLGCYVDNGERDLPLVNNAAHETTRPFCVKYCKDLGYKFAGLQNGNQCTCGNSYGAFGSVAKTQCDKDCEGDKREKCGGAWRNSVYSTGLTTVVVATPGAEYLGCYVDAAVRDLPHLAGTTNMTVPKCYQLCRGLNYRFFAVQFSTTCFCGNHYGRYGKVANTECRMQCSGDKTTYCGSSWRNGLYTTGLEVASLAAGVRSLGCYVDTSARDMPLLYDAQYSTSKAFCFQYCRDREYRYFGLQAGSQCTCGNDYGRFGRADSTTCMTECQGEKLTKCGGSWRNDIYTTGLGTPDFKVAGVDLLGCFVDAATRDLDKLGGTGNMTLDKCLGLCKKENFRFFGVQNSNECWCGNHYGRYGLKENSECRMQCSGDKTTYCGGEWRNLLYTTGIVDIPANVSYLGCFIDNDIRDLPVVNTVGSTATKVFCIKSCKDSGYKFAGLQNGNQCTCGNSYGALGKVSDSQCNKDCEGDRRDKCGDAWRNSIYSTGLVTPTFTAPGLTYIGCYVDSSERDLPYLAASGLMSIFKCYQLCQGLSYRFFGVQNGNECWCGNHYGRFGIKSNTECRAQCDGEKTSYCGAGWRNSVFTTGVEVATAAAGVRDLGCYNDTTDRDLPYQYTAGFETTKEYCWLYCRRAGYVYFGLQGGNNCFCGNTYGRYGKLTDSSCSVECAGDKRTKCGGAMKNQIFTTGLNPIPVPAPDKMVRIGCFVDAAVRDLDKLGGNVNMTVEKCYALCKKDSYRFFGVQNGNECWCGNHYGRYERRDKNECRMQCTGDKATYCGAAWRNEIFTTGIEDVPADLSSLGCYVDTADRDLPLVFDANVKTTKAFCLKYCKDQGYKFFGLQNGNQCTCGNSYGLFGRVEIAQCNKDCQGDSREKCGAGWRNEVFATGLASPVASTPDMKYLGCYVDDPTRDLPYLASSENMTIAKCYQLCKTSNYMFFGVQFSKECWCGNSYGRYGVKSNIECRMQCTGDKTSYCGSNWRNNVYTTGVQIATEKDGVKRIGCFVDTASRDLPLVQNANADTTKAYCWKFCKDKSYLFFGLQNGNQCTCGNSYGAFGRASEDTCNSTCMGNRGENCGGAWRNEVFSTGLDATPLTAPGLKRLGCFKDSSDRDLPKLAATGNMTALRCYSECRKLNYQFFGLQFSTECWCGNTYGRLGRADDIECRMQCTGDKTAYCGDNWRNDVYTTGVETEASSCPLGTTEAFVEQRTCACEPPSGEVPLGSLVFVIDTTGSMGSVIGSAKANIENIMAANKRFKDYVIAGFNDPYYRQLKKTANKDEVTAFLKTLTASGGGDCPEFALAGAFDAAELAEPNSVMIMFTDASAKDSSRTDEVAARLKAKRIRFFIAVNGNLCGTKGTEFQTLANVTFGQFASLGSGNQDKVMEFIQKGASGALSFSAFPTDPTSLTDALNGKCACRTVNVRMCLKPHTGFLGCYKDDNSNPELAVATTATDMTVWKCNDLCKAKKLPYFGLKAGKVCGCGDNYGNYGDVANAMCDAPCAGNAGEKCGGSAYNGLFEVK